MVTRAIGEALTGMDIMTVTMTDITVADIILIPIPTRAMAVITDLAAAVQDPPTALTASEALHAANNVAVEMRVMLNHSARA
jgi:hypothetical protein